MNTRIVIVFAEPVTKVTVSDVKRERARKLYMMHATDWRTTYKGLTNIIGDKPGPLTASIHTVARVLKSLVLMLAPHTARTRPHVIWCAGVRVRVHSVT